LARVFDQALERYREDMPVARAETGVHAELAKYLVTIAQGGELDEDRLVTKGYLKLQSLHDVNGDMAHRQLSRSDFR
jgi:hypothetical protein